MSKISILVPVYKVEKYLERCLDSILAQTFTDWECIIIDDGSPDNSGKICDEYAEIMNKIVSAESPDFSPKTSKNLKNRQNVKRYIDCAGCNYKEVCRTTYSVAGKQLKTEK